MFEIVKTALTRDHDGLWQDTLGGLSLIVMLVCALHLPVLL